MFINADIDHYRAIDRFYHLKQRELVRAYASSVRDRGFAVLGSVEFGSRWQEAVQAAADVFDGVVLEGEFPPDAAAHALAELRKAKPGYLCAGMGDRSRSCGVVEARIRSSRIRRSRSSMAGISRTRLNCSTMFPSRG